MRKFEAKFILASLALWGSSSRRRPELNKLSRRACATLCLGELAPEKKSNNHSFSIGQNDDFYLIEAIKNYFEVSNKVINPYGSFYYLEVYKKEVLSKIILHCINYPLLGDKLESLKKISKKLS